jgi:hypothetical protein
MITVSLSATTTSVLAVRSKVAIALPAIYRSTAVILVEEQAIPQEFIKSTITSFADERIQVISQRVLTRTTLLQLVEKYDLYPTERRRETNDEILERMRKASQKLPPGTNDMGFTRPAILPSMMRQEMPNRMLAALLT